MVTTAELKGTFFWVPVLVISLLTLVVLVWLDLRPESTVWDLAENGSPDALYQKISSDVSLNERNRQGLVPLACAVRGGRLEAVVMLLNAGAEPDTLCEKGNTALHYAVEQERPAVIACLLDAGADPHLQNDSGESPFFLAVDRNYSSVSLFLERGVVPDEDRTPEKDGYFFCAARSGCMPVLHQILNTDCDVNRLSPLGMSALHCAVYGEHLDTALLLVEHGADVDLCDRHQWSPLHQAVRSGDKEMVFLLVEHGADLEARDLEECTPLLVAVEEGRLDLVQALAELGADIDAENKTRKTAEDLARSGNHSEILAFLNECRQKAPRRPVLF